MTNERMTNDELKPEARNPKAEGKKKYPRAEALAVVRELLKDFGPCCSRIVVAGSLRRRKAEVGDIEFVYIPKTGVLPDGLFDKRTVNLASEAIERMVTKMMLQPRLNANGYLTWGERNRLAKHCKSGIPVDFFMTNEECWWNYLVCRTGPAESNIEVCMAAKRQGWKWHPYEEGFSDEEGHLVAVKAERDVFELVGMAYKEPRDR